MSTYKLYYFDSRGTGEPARLIFAQAGVKYEDIRITHEEWGTSDHKHCKQSKMSARIARLIIVYTYVIEKARHLDSCQSWKLTAQR